MIRSLAVAVLSVAVAAGFAVPSHAASAPVGAVYTMTNDPAGNSVLVFSRAADGSLMPAGSFPTGGLGTGGREPDSGLGNAGALTLSANGQLLFVVNPGSDDLSVFATAPHGVRLIDRVPSGGRQPISVTVHDNLVYVLNAGGQVGGSDNISGFAVNRRGMLSPLSGSLRPLSAANTAPSQVQFTADGSVLVVTEKTTNVIDTYSVDNHGLATGPRVTAADAQTPFGFDFGHQNYLFIADDFNDAPGAAALSSYQLFYDGSLRLISSAVPSQQSGACWVAVTPDGRFAYVANTVSSAVSQYRIAAYDGAIKFLSSFPSVSNPTDMHFSRDGRFLYVLAPDQTGQSSPGINVFQVRLTGALAPLSGISGLPLTIDGLAVQ